jgi:glycine oxidase
MSDFVVVGAGLSGLLTARELVLAGAAVTVVERGEVGRESSWAGGGILSPLCPWSQPEPVLRLVRWSQREYPALCAQLAASTGIDPQWVPSGLLMLDAAGPEAETWSRAYAMPLERLDAQAALRTEPSLVEAAAAVWLPEVAQVRNPELLKALYAEVTRLGVTVVEHAEVRRIAVDGADGVRVETPTRSFSVGGAVLTAGAWTAHLVSPPSSVPVFPVRGQMLLFQGPPRLLSRIVLKEGHYAIPRRDGRILVGSTLEHVGFDKQATPQAAAELLAVARQLVRGLADLPVERHWAGLRPGSPTGVPFISAVPGLNRVFINAGHYRNGVVMGPAAARLAADLVLGREPTFDASAYCLPATHAVQGAGGLA